MAYILIHLLFKKDNSGTLEIKCLSHTKNLLQEHLIEATLWVFVSKRKKKQINSIVAFHRQQKYQKFSKNCLSIKIIRTISRILRGHNLLTIRKYYGTNIFEISLVEYWLIGLNNYKCAAKRSTIISSIHSFKLSFHHR